MAVEPAALPLVVRAGGGSARDSLSVLDQLIGGAGPAGVTHELASGLLGYTPDSLLDEVVDAFAAGDGAAVFGVVDKVIETGQDPRRFTEDLLRRLRDLVIVAAVPGATASGLIDVSEDQGERLVAQAARFGASDLSRAADILATGLTEMRGATAPRLLLELLCARVLLPGADHTTHGIAARLDRLERRASITGTPTRGGARSPAPRPGRGPPRPPRTGPRPPRPPRSAAPVPEPEPVAEAPEPAAETRSRALPAAPAAPPARGGGGLSPRRRTPPLARRRRVHQGPPPDGLDPPDPELPGGRPRRQRAHPRLRQRRRPRQLRVQRLLGGGPPGRDRRGRCGLEDRDHRRPGRPARGRADGHQGGHRPAAAATATPQADPEATTEPETPAAPPAWAADEQAVGPRRPTPRAAKAAAREAIQQTRAKGAEVPRTDDLAVADAEVSRDDLDDDPDNLGGEDLLARELGASMIEEIKHS